MSAGVNRKGLMYVVAMVRKMEMKQEVSSHAAASWQALPDPQWDHF